jgi:hypothetical protein
MTLENPGEGRKQSTRAIASEDQTVIAIAGV